MSQTGSEKTWRRGFTAWLCSCGPWVSPVWWQVSCHLGFSASLTWRPMSALVSLKSKVDCYHGDPRAVLSLSKQWRLTCKHLAEVAGVHLHDHVGFDLRLTLPDTAGPTLQVQEPNTCVFTLHTKTHMMNIPTGSPHMDQRSSQGYEFRIKCRPDETIWDPDIYGTQDPGLTWKVEPINAQRRFDQVFVDDSPDDVKRTFYWPTSGSCSWRRFEGWCGA